MGISVNFLSIGRFSLDKKIPRAIVSEPIEVFRLTISENLGSYRGNAYRGLFCTWQRETPAHKGRTLVRVELCIFHALPLSLLTYPLYHARGRGGNAQTAGYVNTPRQISTIFSQLKKVNLG